MAQEEAQQTLGQIIEAARQGARRSLTQIAAEVKRFEMAYAHGKAQRIVTVREAVKVLDIAEVAAILNVSPSTVSGWARDPDKPKRSRSAGERPDPPEDIKEQIAAQQAGEDPIDQLLANEENPFGALDTLDGS